MWTLAVQIFILEYIILPFTTGDVVASLAIYDMIIEDILDYHLVSKHDIGNIILTYTNEWNLIDNDIC